MKYVGVSDPVNARDSPRAYRLFGAFRFMLALMVLLQHSLLLLPPERKNLFYTLELGAVAVTCFFALSGFIVGEAMCSFYAGRPFAFLGNRILRVVPPYLLALCLAICVQSALFAAGRLVPLDARPDGAPWQPRIILAAMCEIVPGLPAWRISGQTFSFVPFAWTLRIEFAFYALAFATCWAMNRLAAGARVALARALAAAAVLLFGLFLMRHGAGPKQVLCIPFFAFGLGCFALERHRAALDWAVLLAIGVAVPLAFTYWGQRGHPAIAYQIPWLCTLLAGFLALSRVRTVPAKLRRLDRHLGDLSYPLYIGHGIALVLLASLVAARGWLPYAACVACSIGLAICLRAVAEKPFEHLRNRLRGSPV